MCFHKLFRFPSFSCLFTVFPALCKTVRFSASWSTIFLLVSSLTLKWIIRSFPSFHILAQILYQLIITWDVFQTAGWMVANFSVLFQHAFFFVLFWLKNPLWLRKEKIFQSTSSKHSVTDVKNEFNAFKYIKCYRIPVSCNSCTCVHGCTPWHH